MASSILEKRMIARFGNQKEFSKVSGIPKSTLSRLMSGKAKWDAERMAVAVDLLKIPAREIPAYFFAADVPKMEEK